MIANSKTKIKGKILESAHRIYAKRTQAKVQTRLVENLFDMIQIGGSTASTGPATASF